VKEKALICAGLRDLRLTFSPAWLRNFVAACGLARFTAAYGGGFGVYLKLLRLCLCYPGGSWGPAGKK